MPLRGGGEQGVWDAKAGMEAEWRRGGDYRVHSGKRRATRPPAGARVRRGAGVRTPPGGGSWGRERGLREQETAEAPGGQDGWEAEGEDGEGRAPGLQETLGRGRGSSRREDWAMEAMGGGSQVPEREKGAARPLGYRRREGLRASPVTARGGKEGKRGSPRTEPSAPTPTPGHLHKGPGCVASAGPSDGRGGP